jgi:ParB family transcriptional regulator, chromosome partitioning protein
MRIPLSKLLASRNNPRRVKPDRDAHERLVASIRAHELLEPLLVRPENGHYRVIAGNRRLAALRQVHGDEDAMVPCVVRKVEAAEAEELSVAENFIREPMHPLDEAEAFARMAREDRKGVDSIASEFGVKEGYVRQRMKLAGLTEVVKKSYRAGAIDTATAETFAAVPPKRQKELWKEVGGKPQHARHIRNLIEDRWIDARHALFDLATLPEGSVSTDLFRDCVLVERGAFMQAQATALAAERDKLTEDGWAEVVIGERAEVQGRLYSMAEPKPNLSKEERARLDKLDGRRRRLEERGDGDSPELSAIDAETESILRSSEGRFSEAAKSRTTVFLVLSPEGEVERHYRVPRKEAKPHNGEIAGGNTEAEDVPPTANDLSDRQKAALNTHEAIAVRQAVLSSAIVRKRLLVLALHDRVATDAIAIRHHANGTTLHAEASDTLKSQAFAEQGAKRNAVDPFKGDRIIEEDKAYHKLAKLSEKELDRLIAALIADCLTGHGQRATPLLTILAEELGVSVRKHWTPDADWLSGYQKIQLADLIGTLRGPVYGSAALNRKKSELVDELAALFSQAAAFVGGFDDPTVAERANTWVPSR